MKKIIIFSLLVVLTLGANAQRGKSKKNQAPDNRPTVVSVVGANGTEEFFLFFDGTKQNKNPQKRYDIKGASLNQEYNMRVVLKKPIATTDMAYTTITPKKMGEEWVVYYNVKRDKVEIMSREQYESQKAKQSSGKKVFLNKANLMRPKVSPVKLDSTSTKVYRIGPSPMNKKNLTPDTASIMPVVDSLYTK